jgi:DNA-binding response OmpR family regulator
VIVVTAEATAAAIVSSRNSKGARILRKPFTTKDLVRRLKAQTLRARDWIGAIDYIGPDRWRFNCGDYQGPRKRKSDHPTMAAAARIRHAPIILKSPIKAIESDPIQALRSMQAQAGDLKQGPEADRGHRRVRTPPRGRGR